MRPLLLISNDDGVSSPFLPFFLRGLARVADFEVVVPEQEQSWIGRAYSRHKTLEIKTQPLGEFSVHTINGTPSDCVNIALTHICKNPDAVVSGINIGQNIGMPLLWSSGTFSAAAEGAMWRFPAFAFSMRLAREYYDACRLRYTMPESSELENSLTAASQTAAEFIRGRLCGEHKAGVVYNVNFPAQYSLQTPLKECEPARAFGSGLYVESGGKFNFKYAMSAEDTPVLTDFKCLESGCACFSEISVL